MIGALFGGEASATDVGPTAPPAAVRDPRVRRAAVLRLRRLRPHRHARRGGDRSRPHDPPGDPARPRHHPRRLRRRRDRRAPGRRSRRRSRRRPRRWPPRCRPGSLDWLGAGGAGRRRRRRRSACCCRSSSASAAPPSRWPPTATCPAGSTPSTPCTGCPTAPSWPSAPSSSPSCRVADLRGAIGFSSFAVLTYYAIANASAWTLPPARATLAPGPGRRRPRRLRRPGLHAAGRQRRRRPDGPGSWRGHLARGPATKSRP